MSFHNAVLLVNSFLFYCAIPVALVECEVLIIIPVPKKPILPPVDISKLRTTVEKNIFGSSHNVRALLNHLKGKIDIQHYDEPTELPDIDNFDYKDRRGSDNEAEDEPNEKIYSVAPIIYDDTNYDEDKIVGGFEVDINLYPYHVSYGNNCGGAIIGKKWVMTAGHCGKKPYIRVGSKYLNQGKRIEVQKSHIHPQWGAKSKEHPFDFDFQLLELAENLKFDENIQPIKIAHIDDMVIGKVITVTGWGNTEENGSHSHVLRAVRVPVISKEHCQHVPFPYFRGSLTKRMFCAGFTGEKKDACQGDSGGPAVANDRLLGMVSFGYGCATPGSFGVYSTVAKVRAWIEEVTGMKLD